MEVSQKLKAVISTDTATIVIAVAENGQIFDLGIKGSKGTKTFPNMSKTELGEVLGKLKAKNEELASLVANEFRKLLKLVKAGKVDAADIKYPAITKESVLEHLIALIESKNQSAKDSHPDEYSEMIATQRRMLGAKSLAELLDITKQPGWEINKIYEPIV